MNAQNHYCCRCHRTTKFAVDGVKLTCTSCGVIVERQARSEGARGMVGNPLRSFKTSFAA